MTFSEKAFLYAASSVILTCSFLAGCSSDRTAPVTDREPKTSTDRIREYTHPDIIKQDASYPETAADVDLDSVISADEAVLRTVEYLNERSVKNIVVCEVDWIAAPLGGYVIDSKGYLELAGITYSLFRVGVRDGSEGSPGKEWLFIALGADRNGKAVWKPGDPSDTAYEFLDKKAKERFKELGERYP